MEIETLIQHSNPKRLTWIINQTLQLLQELDNTPNPQQELEIIEEQLEHLGTTIQKHGITELNGQDHPRLATLALLLLLLWWTTWTELTGEDHPEYVQELALPLLTNPPTPE